MMNKFRILSLILVCALMLGLACPALAADQNTFLVDLMPYNLGMYSEDSFWINGWTFFGSTGEIRFNLPVRSPVYYIDVILYLNQGDANSYSFVSSGADLNTVIFGDENNFIRLYGNLDSPTESTYFPLQLISSVNIDATVISAKYSPSGSPFEVSPSRQQLTIGGDTYTWDYPNFYARYMEESSIFYYELTIDDWKAYDYLDFVCQVTSYSISSIAVYVDGGTSVPFTHSFIDGSGDFSNVNDLISLEIDLSSLDRSLGSRIWIEFRGTTGIGSCYYRALSIAGFVNGTGPDPTVTWLGRVVAAIDSAATSLISYISTGFSDLKAELTRVGNSLAATFSNKIQEVVSSLESNFSYVISQLDRGFSNVVNTVKTWGENIYNVLIGDPDQENPIDDGRLEEESEKLDEAIQGITQAPDPDFSGFDFADIWLGLNSLLDGGFGGNDPITYTSWLLPIVSNENFSFMMYISSIFMTGSFVLFGKKR